MFAPWVTSGAAAAPEPLADVRLQEARLALQEGDLEASLTVALAVLRDFPDDAEAHVVAALSYYRSSQLAEALDHFDQAIALGEESAILLFNRASSLYSLERFADAEPAFVRTAKLAQAQGGQDVLAGLAWVNAGYAAIDNGQPGRARAYLARARERNLCGALEASCEDLASELAHRVAESQADGLEKLSAGDYAQARQALETALQARPDDAELNYHAGVAAYGDGDDDAAYRYLARAQRHRLGGENSEMATAYLDRLAGGLRLMGRGLSLLASASVAYDENVTLSASSEGVAELLGAKSSPALGLWADLSYGQELSPDFFARVGYSVQQSLYTVSTLSDWSSQDHMLSAQVEHVLSARIRAGLMLYGALGLVGVSDLRGRGLDLGSQLYIAYQLNRVHRFQFGIGVGGGFALASEFDYLGGSAVDANFSYQWLQSGFRGLSSFYLRGRGLGTQLLAGDLPSLDELQQLGCLQNSIVAEQGCQAQYAVPLSYDAVGLSVAATYRWIDLLLPMVRVALEGRLYRRPFVRELVGVLGSVSSRLEVSLQRDLRVRLLGGVTWTLTSYLRLFTGYELSLGLSNVTGAQRDYGDESFSRHWLQGELILTL